MCKISKIAAISSHKNKRMGGGQAKRMGLKSREFENFVANNLDYDVVFLPQSICDRIVVMGGKPLLIEIKHKGEKLRPKQKQAQKLFGEYYKVVEK